MLGGVYSWVVIDGKLVANLTGLCPRCHDEVTGRVGGHKSAIRYEVDENAFYWCDVVTVDGTIEFDQVGPLDPQPPTPDMLAARASGHVTESATCPFCGQHKRRPSASGRSVGGRRRKTWTVKVPDDEQEHGADVLDTLIDDLAPLLGYQADAGGRYYVLVPVLAYAQQNKRAFVEAIKGVGG